MSVTWFTTKEQVHVDLEIENTLRRLWKEARINTMVIARQWTLKELVVPNMENQPLCININNNANLEWHEEDFPAEVFLGLLSCQ
jgi:hypothetical protein